MISSRVFCLSIIYSYVILLGKPVICREFSACYNDVNICLWTNGSDLTQSAAERACQQRHSFLPRITNSSTQSKLSQFRSDASHLLGNLGFWIDVKRVDEGNFHWIDGSSLAGGDVHDQTSNDHRCVVIAYVNGQFVYSARRWSNQSSSYICQLPQQDCGTAAGDLSLNSKCYRKFDSRLSWFSASNDCLSKRGSLAVFTDIGQLTDWLNTNKTYWIGLVRFWWKTAGENIQYSNWETGHPETHHRCVIVKEGNYWNTINCDIKQRFVCQNYTGQTTITATTTTSSTISSTTVNGPNVNIPTTSSTTTSASPPSTKMSSSSDKPVEPETNTPPNVGVIVGATVAAIVGVLIIVAIIVLVILLLRHKQRQSKTTGVVSEKEVTYADIALVNQPDVVNNGVRPDQPVVYSTLNRPNGNV